MGDRWWNVEVTVTVPFATEVEAKSALHDPDLERFALLSHEIFGGCREVMVCRVREATDSD